MVTLGVTLESVDPGRVVAGRTINVVEARATQHGPDGADSKLVATMTATIMTVQGREALHH